jgi:8-oxo-dGTP diphosphatase
MEKRKDISIVTAAVIEKNGRVLIAKKRQGSKFAGKWEFPGGKVEKGETPEQCLKRELGEELAVTAEIGGIFCTSEHTYMPQQTIRLLAYRTTLISDGFDLNDHEEIRWVEPANLGRYVFLEADKPIVEKLMKETRNKV